MAFLCPHSHAPVQHLGAHRLGAPYHYTLLTCVKAVVRTTALLTRPHTHPLNTGLQKRPRTNRYTHFHKHTTHKSSTFVESSKRVQKELVEKDEVIDGPSLERMHRRAVLRAP